MKRPSLFLYEVLFENPNYSWVWYNKACSHALLNQKNEAITALIKAIALEPELLNDVNTDTDFNSIKDTPEFKKLING